MEQLDVVQVETPELHLLLPGPKADPLWMHLPLNQCISSKGKLQSNQKTPTFLKESTSFQLISDFWVPTQSLPLSGELWSSRCSIPPCSPSCSNGTIVLV